MYKKMLFSAILIVMLAAPMAFAGDLPATSLPTATDSFRYSLSADVTCYYGTDTAYKQYGLACKHKGGNRVIAGTNAASKIWYKEDAAYIGEAISGSNVATAAGEVTMGGDDTTFTGWETM